jgi:hypothetical protein
MVTSWWIGIGDMVEVAEELEVDMVEEVRMVEEEKKFMMDNYEDNLGSVTMLMWRNTLPR